MSTSFKTELHCHCTEVSNCATAPVDLIVRRYLAAGYTTVVLTNHLSKYTYKNGRFDHSDWSWDEKIDYFMDGFHRLEAAADGRLHVILGCELRSNCDDNDYQIYGVTEDFLRAVPDMMDVKISELSQKIRAAGMLFFQAHPFRNEMRITDPKYLDGIEIYNGHIGAQSRNDIAALWAQKYHLKVSSGSDFHHAWHRIDGGIETDTPITDTKTLLNTLKSGAYRLIRTDDVPY